MEHTNLNRRLRGILIDPATQSVAEVLVDPYPGWKELIDVDTIAAVTLLWYEDGCNETVWIDDNGLLGDKKDGPYFMVPSNSQPIAGKGIVLGTDQSGETVSTRLTEETVRMITQFPHVRFVGFQQLEPKTVEVPGFGPMMQVGQRAIFEPLDPEEKGD